MAQIGCSVCVRPKLTLEHGPCHTVSSSNLSPALTPSKKKNLEKLSPALRRSQGRTHEAAAAAVDGSRRCAAPMRAPRRRIPESEAAAGGAAIINATNPAVSSFRPFRA